MGIFRATRHKTLLKLSAAIFVLSSIIFSLIYPIKTVSAATSLTLAWKDAQTIVVAGALSGNITGSVATSGQLPFFGTVSSTPSNLCNYLYVAVDTSNNTAVVESAKDGGVVSSTTKPCYAETLGISSPVSISGTRLSTATETSDQQKTNIYLASNLNKDASPATVKFTLKNAAGRVISTPTVPKTISTTTQGSGSAGTNYNVDYNYTFTLVPDTYNICFSAIDTSCHSFTKVKYEATSKFYGVRGSYNYINVLVSSDAPQAASANFTVAAQKITLSQGGKILQTVTAPQYVHKAVINDQSGGGTSIVSVPQLATFNNVSPGTYQICVVTTNACATVKKVVDAHTIPDPIVISTSANVISSDTNSSSSCQDSNIALGWIMCELISGLTGAVDGIYKNVISPMLQEDTSSSNPALDTAKVAWSGFRVYADIFLVIALLVVVFGQSIGGGLIDAYSAKKILPRLLLAVILINLSFYLVKLMLDITNVVGGGIVDLITKPFGSGASSFALNIKINSAGQVVTLGAISAGVIAAFTGGMAFLGWVWPFVLLPALLSLIATFIIILIRRGLIILLIIFSPVAFALYVLPNTAKYFKQWWDLLFKTLLVYPIIMVLLALSQIMAVVISSGGGSGISPAVAGILSVVALVIPLFLIPFAFKLSGGIIGQASQLVNGLSNKARQGILGDPKNTNSLRSRSKRNLAARYADKNLSGKAIGTRLNPTTAFGNRKEIRKARLANTRDTLQGVYAAQGMGNATFEKNKDNDKIMGDLATYASGSESRQAIENEIIARTLVRGSDNHKQRLFSSAAADEIGRTPAMQRRALMNPATIGYFLGQGEDGFNQANEIMKRVSGGDVGSYRSMIDEFQYLAKQSGRSDIAGFKEYTTFSAEKARTEGSVYERGTTDKPSNIKANAKYSVDTFLSGGADEKLRSAAWYIENKAALPSSKGPQRDALMDAQKDLDAAGMTAYLATPDGTGRTITEVVRDPSSKDPDKKIYRTRDVTFGDNATQLARPYEPPDPNRVT